MSLPALPTTADIRSITERVNVLIRGLWNPGTSNQTLVHDGNNPVWASDTRVLQIVNTQTGALATGTTTIPYDDTIPQNTEGDQYMSLEITTRSASSKLRIEVTGDWSKSSTLGTLIAALFIDSDADALAAMAGGPPNGAGFDANVKFTHVMDSPGVGTFTFKVRAGCDQAGTVTFNGRAGARALGGVMASSITITEYL